MILLPNGIRQPVIQWIPSRGGDKRHQVRAQRTDNTMQVQIRINQKEAIKRGIDAPHSTAKIDINPAEFTQPERDWIASQLYDGFRLDYYGYVQVPAPTVEGLREAIREELEKPKREAEAKAQREAEKLAECIADLKARKTKTAHCYEFASGRAKNADYSYPYFDYPAEMEQAATEQVPGAKEWLASLETGKAEAIAKAVAQARANEAACAAEDKAEEERKLAIEQFKQDWIQKHGTDNQRGRLAAGLLPDAEIVQAITDATFASIQSEAYEKLTADDVDCTCQYNEDCKVEFDAGDDDKATAEQWDALCALKAQLPENATVQLRWHKAEREECDQSVLRYSLKATVPIGPMTVSREFKA